MTVLHVKLRICIFLAVQPIRQQPSINWRQQSALYIAA